MKTRRVPTFFVGIVGMVFLFLLATSFSPVVQKTKANSAKPLAPFTVTHTISLQTMNGHYMVAENGGGAQVGADRVAVGPWEQFTINDLNDGNLVHGNIVTLQANNGQYWTATNGGGSSLNATASIASTYETFVIEKVIGTEDYPVSPTLGTTINNGDVVALRTYKGNYVIAQDGGGNTAHASPTARGPHELFTIRFY